MGNIGPVNSISRVDYLFDRPVQVHHRWRGALAQLNSEPRNNLRATGANLCMDWRVTSAAESELVAAPEFVARKLSAGLDSAFGAYFSSHYCQPAKAVAFTDPTDLRLPSHRKLLHIATLDSMIRRIWRRDDTRAALSQEIRLVLGETILVGSISPGEPEDDSLDQLATRLNQVGEAAVKILVASILDLLGPAQPHWWAAFHGEVEEYLDDGRMLINALGLGDLSDGQWLVVYVYTVADAGLVYRPTIVEANRYAFHFVSPPSLNMGLTMPVGTNMPACGEVIHYPLSPEMASGACTGTLLRIGANRADATDRDRNDQSRYAALGTLRAQQRHRIRKRYAAAQQWLDRHEAAF